MQSVAVSGSRTVRTSDRALGHGAYVDAGRGQGLHSEVIEIVESEGPTPREDPDRMINEASREIVGQRPPLIYKSPAGPLAHRVEQGTFNLILGV
jgi:hypothetical protein